MPVFILQNEFAQIVQQDFLKLFGNLVTIDASGRISLANATLPYGDVLRFLINNGSYVGIRGESSNFTLNPNLPLFLRDRGGVTIRTSQNLPTASVEIIYDVHKANNKGYFVFDEGSNKIEQFQEIILLHELAHAQFQTVAGMTIGSEDASVEAIENSYRRQRKLPIRKGHDGGIGRPAVPQGETCFTASAQVLTPDGYQSIGSLEVGSPILSYDLRSACLRQRIVSKKIQHAVGRVWKISTERSCSIETTANHMFLTMRGWVRAKQLKTGDEILAEPGETGPSSHRVVGVLDTGRNEVVYNLYTTGEHTFLVDGYVVHNFTFFRSFRTWWHKLFVDPYVKIGCSKILLNLQGA